MGTQRRAFKHAAIYSTAAILGKAIGVLMLPFYAHILHEIGYGVIGMIDASLSLLTSLLAYGFRGAMTRFFHEAEGDDKNRVISTAIVLATVATTTIIAPAMLFSGPLSSFILGDPEFSHLFRLALVTFLFDIIGQTAGALLIIKHRSIQFAMIGLIRLVLGLGLNILLIVILRWGLLGYFISNLAVAFISFILFAFIAWKNCGLGFDRRIALNICRFQLPLIPAAFASWISRQVERILIRHNLGIGDVGVLEMAYKFPYLITMFAIEPFMKSWDTQRMEIAERNDSDAPVIIGNMFTIFLMILVFLGLLLATGIRYILQILTPPEFWPAARIAQLEVLTTVLMGCIFYMQFGLVYLKDTRTIAIVNGVTSTVKVIISYFFITSMGLAGAAYSACIAASTTLIWMSIRSQKAWPLKLEYGKILLIVSVATCLFVTLENIRFTEYPFVSDLEERIFPAATAEPTTLAPDAGKMEKLATLVKERSTPMMELSIRVLLCPLFFLMAPLIRVRLLQNFRFIRRRRRPPRAESREVEE